MEHSYIELSQVCGGNICPDLPPLDLVTSIFDMSTHGACSVAFVESAVDHFCGECKAPERSEQRLSWLEHLRRRGSSVNAVSEVDMWLEGTGRREAESDSFRLAHLACISIISLGIIGKGGGESILLQ